jgi:hypothetical protein
MKIRYSFVSNSSSSSFVLIADKNVYKKAMNNIHPYVEYLIGKPDNVTINDTDLVMFNGEESSEDFGYELKNYIGEILDHSGKVIAEKKEEGYLDDTNDDVDQYDTMTVCGALYYLEKAMNKIKSHSAFYTSNRH